MSDFTPTVVIFDENHVSTFSDSRSCDLLSSEEWTSVLKLSTMWHFQDIRAKAIKALESPTLSLDAVDKIVMARKYDISPWLVPSLHALVQREKPLDLSEGNRLGLEWVLKVAEVREYSATVRARGESIGVGWGQSLEPLDRASINCCDKIRETFGLE